MTLEQLPNRRSQTIEVHCFTGGLEFALACDFLVAAESTKLGDTHGQMGLGSKHRSPIPYA